MTDVCGLKRPILYLVGVHVACDLIALVLAGLLRHFGPAIVVFAALLSAQVCLLGIWAGLGNLRWPLRTAGVFSGLGFIGGVAILADDMWRRNWGSLLTLIGLILAATVVVALFLVVLRVWFLRVAFLEPSGPVALAEGLQFRIRDLLVLTAVVALLLGLGRIVHWTSGPRGVNSSELLAMAVMVLGVVSVALLTLWTGLGMGKPGPRLLILLPFCVATGAFIPYIQSGSPWWRYVVWIGLTVVEALLVVTSLWVVRSCGYRLVRKGSFGRKGH